MNARNKHIPRLVIVFGAIGDLNYRKLFPLIFHLYQQDNLDEHIAVIGIGRRDITSSDFCNQVRSSIQRHVKNIDRVDAFMEHVFYHRYDVSNEESYQKLPDFSNELGSQFELEGNRLFYLAMAPQFFGAISDYLKSSGLTDTKGLKRLIIEKPLGSDLKPVEVLNN